MTDPENKLDHRRKKLKFRAWHRGIKEMDLIMGRYADENLENMSATQMDQFSSMLKQADDEVYTWISGQKPVPEEFDNDIMQTLKSFRMIPEDFTRTD